MLMYYDINDTELQWEKADMQWRGVWYSVCLLDVNDKASGLFCGQVAGDLIVIIHKLFQLFRSQVDVTIKPAIKFVII